MQSHLDVLVTSRTMALRTDWSRWRSQAGSPANTTLQVKMGLRTAFVAGGCIPKRLVLKVSLYAMDTEQKIAKRSH